MEYKRDNAIFLSMFSCIYMTVLVISPVTSAKIVAVGPICFPGGTLIFPITFILNDILTEVYGYHITKKVIWQGFLCQISSILIYTMINLMPRTILAQPAGLQFGLEFYPQANIREC